MCARFSLYATPAQIALLLDIEIPDTPPRYNIAPTQTVLGAIERTGERQLREFRWGLIPSWAKDPSIGNKMINARAETVIEKASFRNAFHRRRCVIPASGFFEWKHDTIEEEVVDDRDRQGPSLFEEFDIPRRKTKSKTIKQPYYFGLKHDEPFGLAGLYEYWHDPNGEKVRSCTVITTEPNELVAPFHDRMPAIIRKPDLDLWLDCDRASTNEAASLLAPIEADEMFLAPVTTALNDPNNEYPELLAGIRSPD
jgi:putative SOS response-associated peptidase YedK